jgi:hypothetical protein
MRRKKKKKERGRLGEEYNEEEKIRTRERSVCVSSLSVALSVVAFVELPH